MISILECFSREPTRAVTGRVVLSGQGGFIGLMIFLAVMMSPGALAGWTDPLNTPASPSNKADQALLLDVTQAGSRLVAVGAYGHIVYSDNAGQRWQQGTVPVSVTLTAVDFVDEQHGWAVGHDGIILASRDGGVSWQKQFDGFQANQALADAIKTQITELEQQQSAAANAGNRQKEEDLEYELENVRFALDDALFDIEKGSTKPFLDVTFFSRNDGFAVGAYGMLFRTRDGGEQWDYAATLFPNPDRMHLSQFHILQSGGWLVVGEMGLVALSQDYGQSWERLALPYDGSLFGALESGQEWLVFGLRGHVFASSDQGQSWRELHTGSEQTLLSGTVTDTGRVTLVGNAGTVLTIDRTPDSGTPMVNIHTLKGRTGLAAAAPVSDGWLLVGETGARRMTQAELKQAAGE